ncbi:MAG TPA: glycoside hydrolase family 43 protein [Solirubrobacterales bacterium]|nr:glycoside hydrolase family 43 protein [Solirubrobacterales bacterium]
MNPSRPVALACLILLGILVAAAPASAAQSSIRNPVVPESADGEDSPDPWIFTHDGRYWLTYTTSGRVEVRSAPTLAGLAGARPRHLWPPAGTAEPEERSLGVWAPEIHRLKGPDGIRWYVYFSATGPDSKLGADTHRMYVLESKGKSPAGPYRFKGRLEVPEPYAIDATVGRLNGRLYLLYAGGASWTPTSIMLMRLKNPWTVGGEPIEISAPTSPWESVPVPINEGPEILIRKNRLHVIFSASWCGAGQYALGRLSVPLRSDLMDPATWATAKAAGAVFQGDPELGVYGPGHGSFFTSPDGRQSWMVYHATEDARGCFTGGLRTTRAQRFGWDGNTPDFGRPVSLSADIAAPGGDRTIAIQAESAPFSPAAGSVRLDDRRFFGYAGATLSPAGPRGTLPALAYRVPRTGSYTLRLRVLAGPDATPVTWLRPKGGGVTRDLNRPEERAIEITLGKVRLRAGRHRLRIRGEGSLAVDQLRLQPG